MIRSFRPANDRPLGVFRRGDLVRVRNGESLGIIRRIMSNEFEKGVYLVYIISDSNVKGEYLLETQEFELALLGEADD